MKKVIIFMVAVVVATAFSSRANAADNLIFGKRIKAEGKKITEVRTSAMKFDKIEVSRGVHVIVEERTDGDIQVTTLSSIMPYVELGVSKGVFKATLSDDLKSVNGNYTIEVRIPNNGKINDIGAYAAGSVTVVPTLQSNEINLSAYGAAKIKATVKAAKCEAEASGASCLDLIVEGGEIDAEISGASKGYLELRTLKSVIEVSGASNLTATGKSDFLDIDVSGASKADASGMTALVCNAEAGGASKLAVKCTESLSAEASGASKIVYSGGCRLASSSAGGASSISKN